MYTNISNEFVGGTMAHSFIMSQVSELEAYKLWASIYPNSTILIDTYDIKKALDMLVDNDIKPAVVRIDSEPLDQWAIYTRAFLDAKGWDDVKIFISGDLTPERLREYEAAGVPFDMCMAGTAYANIGDVADINAGFVYKLVQFERDGKTFYPEKKSEGKGSLGGLKTLRYDTETKIVTVSSDKGRMFGFDVDVGSSRIADVIMEGEMSNIKIRTEQVIDSFDWDDLVTETYGRPYNFQQQDDCKSRGVFRFSVPSKDVHDYDNDTVPEIVNHHDMGVSFKAWLARDTAQLLPKDRPPEEWKEWMEGRRASSLSLWWERNFYPDVQMVANDLHAKGLLEAGDYTIDIDW